MTPEQLSATIVDVLTALSEEGAITLPDGVPATVTVERPRQKGHGDYATNVALQLAKKAGTNPRELRGARPGAARGRRRRGRGGDRRPRLPQHHGRGRRPGRRGRAGRRRRAGVRPHRDPRRAADQRGVHLRQPHRPPPPRAHPLGRRGRRGRAGARGGRRERDPRVLHQRPRQPDGPLRRLDRGRRARPARPRGRLPGRLRPRPRRSRCWPTTPASSTCPRTSALVAFREAGYAVQLAGAEGPARRAPDPLRRVVLRALPPREQRRRRRAGEAAQPGSPVRRRRRAVDADHRLRRRQGPGADPDQRRADLLRQRHGVLRQQAGARLRGLHLPARRRPPRVRRPPQGDVGLHRGRPGDQHRGPDRPDGEDHEGRRGGQALEAGGHHRHAG